MDGLIHVLGRRFDRQELLELQGWIDQQAGCSRRRLSVALAQLWQWRNARGQWRDMATRLLLNRLERQNLLRLPARQKRGGRRQVRAGLAPLAPPTEPMPGSLSALQPLRVGVLPPAAAERRRLVQYLAQHHYLGYPHPLGQLHYLVQDQRGRDLAVLLFGPAAWQCRGRDAFIGWSALQRQAHLAGLVQNSRFLILPWARVPQLASHVLARVTARLRADWQEHYGQQVVLVESFVECQRFAATAYRAANWRYVGRTVGRGRADRHHQQCRPIKAIYLYPLVAHWQALLCA